MTRVVAAAIVDDGRVLAAHRRRPAGWEFPGGKVETGESDEAALARELAEELGVAAVIGEHLGTARDGTVELLLYAAGLDGARPTAHDDHDELAWLAPGELQAMAWLPLDRALLAAVRGLLARGSGG